MGANTSTRTDPCMLSDDDGKLKNLFKKKKVHI